MKAFEPLPFAVCWPQDGEESSGTSPRPAMCFTPASALSLQSTPDGVTRAPSGGVPTEAVSWLAIYIYMYIYIYLQSCIILTIMIFPVIKNKK